MIAILTAPSLSINPRIQDTLAIIAKDTQKIGIEPTHTIMANVPKPVKREIIVMAQVLSIPIWYAMNVKKIFTVTAFIGIRLTRSAVRIAKAMIAP